ncbi:MAG: OsmC family protein [Chitinophagaceae bacterium]|nr:OsmC family protein [Chitinophagaceae bacterium]
MIKETEKIKNALERCKKAFTLKPAMGRDTAVSKVRMVNGLSCEVSEGNWKFSVDMPEGIGGSNTAPTPGVYGRAALGSCLAIGYMMKAAELNIPVKNLEVEVQADFDDGALLGTADKTIPPGYLEVRYTITIESDAPEEKIMQMLDDGDVHSPYLDVFSRAQKCVRKINIVSAKINN